jgi:hypothetical protein
LHRQRIETTVAPWGLRFGQDTWETVVAKLVRAGFRASAGCVNIYPHSTSYAVNKCLLENRSIRGLQGASIEIFKDSSTTRVAALSYTFDTSEWSDVIKQLVTQYGEPDSSYEGTASWWVGPIGINVVRTKDFFAVSYFNGRLQQLSYKVMRESLANESAIRNKGL